jgi:hypothetical protein
VGVNYFIGKKSHHGEEERLLYLLTLYLFKKRRYNDRGGDCLCDKISQSMGRFLLYLIRTLYQSPSFFSFYLFIYLFLSVCLHW